MSSRNHHEYYLQLHRTNAIICLNDARRFRENPLSGPRIRNGITGEVYYYPNADVEAFNHACAETRRAIRHAQELSKLEATPCPMSA